MLPSGLFTQFNVLADVFITEVNATPLTLHYSDQMTALAEPDPNVIPSMDDYGGRVPPAGMDGRFQEGGTNVKEEDRTETVLVRAYWIINPIYDAEKQIDVINSRNQVKIICFATDYPRLQNAKYANIQYQGRNVKINMLRPGVERGMGQPKRYMVTFWEEWNV